MPSAPRLLSVAYLLVRPTTSGRHAFPGEGRNADDLPRASALRTDDGSPAHCAWDCGVLVHSLGRNDASRRSRTTTSKGVATSWGASLRGTAVFRRCCGRKLCRQFLL